MQINLSANTDLRSLEEFRNLVVRQSGDSLVRLRDVADVVLGAEDYDSEVRFGGERAVFMGIWPLPNANALDVIKRVRAEMVQIQKELPTGLTGSIAYDATTYIDDAIHEVLKTLTETLIIVAIVIFLFLGLAALGAGAAGGHSHLADRGGLPHAGLRVHIEPADAAGHRAVGRPRGGRRHRDRRERGAARARGPDARSRPPSWARANSSARSSR